MATPGPLTRYQFDTNGVTYDLWCKPGALDGLVGGLTEVTEGSPINIIQNVGGFTRQQYPNDPTPVSVSGHTRRRLIADPAKLKTLPGVNAYVEVEVSDGTTTTTEVTTITTTAPFIDLHSHFTGSALTDLVLRSANGVPYNIGDSTP